MFIDLDGSPSADLYKPLVMNDRHSAAKQLLEFIHFVCFRPVRDGTNLARHFSAGTSENKQMSPVGTKEYNVEYDEKYVWG
jgi:hypothetical protein